MFGPSIAPSPENIPANQIAVKGEMSDSRRERLRQALIRHWQGELKPDTIKRLTSERLQELASLAHVESVTPNINFVVVSTSMTRIAPALLSP